MKNFNRIWFGVLFFLVALKLLYSCTNVVPENISTSTETSTSKVVLGDWKNEEWSKFAYEGLELYGKEMLAANPMDSSLWCLPKEKRKEYYTWLISFMSKFESSHNPKVQYRENFRDGHGDLVISRGLLQLSKESANLYGCNIKDANELHDPRTNIHCAVRILNRWIVRDKVIANEKLGGGRYWSVLRPGLKKDSIRNSICKESI